MLNKSPVIKINLVDSNFQDKGQCLPSSDTSEVAVLQLSNEDILQINEGGWEIFWKKWWTCCFFYEGSDEFVIVLLCACVQPAFSESRRAFAYACMLWWQICEKWISNNLQGKVKKLGLLEGSVASKGEAVQVLLGRKKKNVLWEWKIQWVVCHKFIMMRPESTVMGRVNHFDRCKISSVLSACLFILFLFLNLLVILCRWRERCTDSLNEIIIE